MERRHFLGGTVALGALGAFGCRDTPSDSPTPSTVEPMDPSALQAALDQMLQEQSWAEMMASYPQELLGLQEMLVEAGMDASARLVGVVGETLLPAVAGALIGLDTDDEQAAKDAFQAGWTQLEGGLRSVQTELPTVSTELDAQGWLGPMDPPDEQLATLNETEVGGRAYAVENGLEDHALVNLGLATVREHKQWLRDGGDTSVALEQATTGIDSLLAHVDAAKVGAKGPPPPPLADFAEGFCDALGVPSWFDYVFGTALGMSSDSCDEERWQAETMTLAVMSVLGLAGIINALFNGTALFGLIVFSGWFGMLLLLVYVLFTGLLILCRIDHIFSSLWECNL